MRPIDADKIDFNEVFAGESEFAQDTRNSVELLDKQKALQWLADHMDFATVKQKAGKAIGRNR